MASSARHKPAQNRRKHAIFFFTFFRRDSRCIPEEPWDFSTGQRFFFFLLSVCQILGGVLKRSPELRNLRAFSTARVRKVLFLVVFWAFSRREGLFVPPPKNRHLRKNALQKPRRKIERPGQGYGCGGCYDIFPPFFTRDAVPHRPKKTFGRFSWRSAKLTPFQCDSSYRKIKTARKAGETSGGHSRE